LFAESGDMGTAEAEHQPDKVWPAGRFTCITRENGPTQVGPDAFGKGTDRLFDLVRRHAQFVDGFVDADG
jgi:hypothetical protein